MKCFQRNDRDLSGSARPGALFTALTLALTLGGCSADVGRFDFPAFNLNGDSGTTSALPTPSEPVVSQRSSLSGGRDSFGGGAYPPPANRSGDRVDMAALPEPAAPPSPPPQSYSTRSAYGTSAYEPPRANYQPPATPSYERSRRAATAGETVQVQRGDTLYGIARSNGVTVNELMAANGLGSPTIHPGQTLRLPGGARPIAAPLDSTPARRTASATPSRVPAPAIPAQDWRGTYQVQAGDSLYRIARQHDVRVADLQRANGITNPRQLKPGSTLRVPGSADAPARVAAAPYATEHDKGEPQAPRAIQSTTQPTVINSERRVAALDTGRISDAAPSAPPDHAKPVQTVAISPSQIASNSLRWPSKGKILSGFGQRADGTHNDGINIAVPKGTEVHAAADGEVAYAGSELKGYGNLVLLRHDNGWVTAYAHADQLLVKRGDKIRRGDVIAKAGATGQVDQPQLHFELRQGSKPVDPLPYLDRL
ncbi:MAG: LysM peptidoglycan-binding domain-containing protein [Hyphomicrobiaceae bacterium]